MRGRNSVCRRASLYQKFASVGVREKGDDDMAASGRHHYTFAVSKDCRNSSKKRTHEKYSCLQFCCSTARDLYCTCNYFLHHMQNVKCYNKNMAGQECSRAMSFYITFEKIFN